MSISCFGQALAVFCWDNLEKQTGYGVHTKKSAVLSSATGWQAYVETEARPVKLESGNCANTSRLFVRKNHQPFRIAYITRPEKYMLGNDLQILGWSGDALLLNDWAWQYASDADANQVVIYHADSGTFEHPDLGKLVAEKLQRACELRAVAKEWKDGRLVFEVSDAAVDVDEPCLKVQDWEFEVKTQAVKPAE